MPLFRSQLTGDGTDLSSRTASSVSRQRFASST